MVGVIASNGDVYTAVRGEGYLVDLEEFGSVSRDISNRVDLQMMDHFTDALDYHINKRHRVLIYPEAHIWPYYNDIRHFKSVSFKYPVNQNVPIFTATTTFKQRKGNKKPKPIIYIDGPFYPDETLPVRDRVNDLAQRKSLTNINMFIKDHYLN